MKRTGVSRVLSWGLSSHRAQLLSRNRGDPAPHTLCQKACPKLHSRSALEGHQILQKVGSSRAPQGSVVPLAVVLTMTQDVHQARAGQCQQPPEHACLLPPLAPQLPSSGSPVSGCFLYQRLGALPGEGEATRILHIQLAALH